MSIDVRRDEAAIGAQPHPGHLPAGPMYTYTAQRLIPAAPPRVPYAIDELVVAFWGDRANRVSVGQPARTFLVAGIDGTPDQRVWLSFRVTPVGRSSHVQVTLDEFTAGPDATEALADLLDLLAISVAVSVATDSVAAAR
jgi:hypothetical protein